MKLLEYRLLSSDPREEKKKLLTKAAVRNKILKLEDHDALKVGSCDHCLERAIKVVTKRDDLAEDEKDITEAQFIEIVRKLKSWQDTIPDRPNPWSGHGRDALDTFGMSKEGAAALAICHQSRKDGLI